MICFYGYETGSQQIVVPFTIFIPHLQSDLVILCQNNITQIKGSPPVGWVVIRDHISASNLNVLFVEHFNVPIGGCGLVTPQVLSPHNCDLYSRKSTLRWAAVWCDPRIVATSAGTWVVWVGFDAIFTRVGAVPPEGLFQDVVTDGVAQVLAHGIFGGDQLMQGLQRVRKHVWVLW